jgi:hypothetical protein
MQLSLTLLAIGCAAASLNVRAQIKAQSFDTPSYVQFSAARFEVSENETNAVVTVVRSGDYRKTASVDFTTVEGSASSNVDFQPCGGTLVFASGQSIKTITIPILRETAGEPVKDFQVQLQQPAANTIVLTDSAVVEIIPQAPALNIALSGNGLTVSWPDVSLPYTLEAQLDGSWTAITTGVVLGENGWSASVPPSGQVAFFRLRLESQE